MKVKRLSILPISNDIIISLLKNSIEIEKFIFNKNNAVYDIYTFIKCIEKKYNHSLNSLCKEIIIPKDIKFSSSFRKCSLLGKTLAYFYKMNTTSIPTLIIYAKTNCNNIEIEISKNKSLLIEYIEFHDKSKSLIKIKESKIEKNEPIKIINFDNIINFITELFIYNETTEH